MCRSRNSLQFPFRALPVFFTLVFIGTITATVGLTFTDSSSNISPSSVHRLQTGFSRSRSHSLGYSLHSSKWPPTNFPLAGKEAFIATNQDGLTLDRCDPTEQCKGGRSCLAVNNDNEPCSGVFLCVCFPKEFIYCTASSQCQEREICADTVFDVRPLCTSRRAVKSFSFLRKAVTSQSTHSPGLTLDSCNNKTVCKGYRTCTFIGNNPEFSDCDGRNPCYCLHPEPSVCFLSSDCEAGEMCADTPLSDPAQCVSKEASERHISVSEVFRPEKSSGLTLDPCDTNTDCKESRKCFRFENDKPVPCQGSKACACLPLKFAKCKNTGDCRSKDEICASTPFKKTPICTSMEARDAYEAVDQVLGPDVCPVKIQTDKPRDLLRLLSQRILKWSGSRWMPGSIDKDGEAFLGGRKLETSQKIVGGLPAPESILNYMAAILNPTFTSLCTGTLISPRWVLTAAHCGTAPGYQVVLGSRLLTGPEGDLNPGGDFFTVTRAFTHPKYRDASVDTLHDIAVVEIDGGSLRDSNFMKINVDNRAPVDGSFVRAIGYGDTSFNDVLMEKKPLSLRQVDLPVIPWDKCNNAYSGVLNPPTISRTGHLCFGSPRDRCGTCQGDSGGPEMQYQSGVATVLGINSFGVGCGEPNFPGVATRVSRNVLWLKSTPAVFYTDEGVFGEDASKCQTGDFQYPLSKSVKFCRPCPPDRTSVGGSTSLCSKCPRGLMRDATDGTKCSCEGRYAVGKGLTKKGRCTDCQKGTFSAEKSSTCKTCEPGTFADNPKSKKCEPCPKGKFADKPGATSCRKCPSGRTSPIGASACSKKNTTSV